MASRWHSYLRLSTPGTANKIPRTLGRSCSRSTERQTHLSRCQNPNSLRNTWVPFAGPTRRSQLVALHLLILPISLILVLSGSGILAFDAGSGHVEHPIASLPRVSLSPLNLGENRVKRQGVADGLLRNANFLSIRSFERWASAHPP